METTIIRVEFTVPAAQTDPFTAFLFDRVAYGWEEDESPQATVFRVHVEDPAFARDLVQETLARWPEIIADKSETPNRDWALAWREFFTAVLCGDDFVVIAPWMLGEQPWKGRIPIVIEPKTAFGTGHHPTTALCLEVVSALWRAGRLQREMRFLDLGCGSSILGLGCVKLGMSGVGLDIDPLAIDNSHENIQVNDVDPSSLRVAEGSLEVLEADPEPECFDLVLANILAEPLMDLGPRILARVKENGVLVLSGLLAIQADAVAETYCNLGLPQPEKRISGEWAALIWK